MSRVIRVGGAQLGPIQKSEGRQVAVARMIELLDQAKAEGCQLVAFPELALTTFFPRWDMDDQSEIDQYFEEEMPNAATQPLFDRAKEYGIAFTFGYAEIAKENGTRHHYNTSILVDAGGNIVGKYRKTHLPGHGEFDPDRAFQHLEKKYFEVGNTGFKVWRFMDGIFGMCICNDRRWPETYRVMGLQGVEMVLLGFNTPTTNSQRDGEAEDLRTFHNDISVQAGAYQNGTWVVSIAKAGIEDGHGLLGGSTIVHPSGQIVARTKTLDDELIVADCDLDECNFFKETIFDFDRHRRPEHYGLITSQTGVVRPD
ncbi:MAG: N-carbamoyl-D-amino-acid hydrolase [Hyphomicrobiaceae bacterium]|nr:N-carbamoyl-D-amino-acid hydrolase [Hyphomicrobiaceae bacterium]